MIRVNNPLRFGNYSEAPVYERVIHPATQTPRLESRPIPVPSRNLLSAIKNLLPVKRSLEQKKVSPVIPDSHKESVDSFLKIVSPFTQGSEIQIFGGTTKVEHQKQVIVALSFTAGDNMEQLEQVNIFSQRIAEMNIEDKFPNSLEVDYHDSEIYPNSIGYTVTKGETSFQFLLTGGHLDNSSKKLKEIVFE